MLKKGIQVMKKKLSDIRIIRHLWDFPYVWLFFFLMIIDAILALYGLWIMAKILCAISVIILVAIMFAKPMNAIYGLMGTTGSIRLFFIVFLFITALFAIIYQLGFFQQAGVSYDVNQPLIDYDLYLNKERKPITINTVTQRDTVIYERVIDCVVTRDTVVKEYRKALNYQPIDFLATWRNTIMTSLMQQPVEFFAAASTHISGIEIDETNIVGYYNQTKQIEGAKLNEQKSIMFNIILIVQVLLSWIFFGVFIAYLYDKFRHDS